MERIQPLLSSLGFNLEDWFENYDFSEEDLEQANEKISEFIKKGFTLEVTPVEDIMEMNFKIVLKKDTTTATLTPMPTGCVWLHIKHKVKLDKGTPVFESEAPYPGFKKAFEALRNILLQIGAL